MPASDLALEKGLPANLDAERFVLGAILMDDSNFVSVAGTLDVEDFSIEKHRRIYLRMTDLAARGERIDRVTLANELMKQGQLESVDGLSYLIQLDNGLPQIFSLDAYVSIVKKKALLRSIVFSSEKLIKRCLMDQEEPDEILAGAEETLLKLGESTAKQTLVSPRRIIEEFEGGLSVFLDPSKRIKGISTGFKKFDEMTAGLHEGELIILAARPSMGKTALALNVAQHVATNPHDMRTVAVFSLEMSKESLLTRLICASARVDQQKYRAGFLNKEERNRLQMAAMTMVEAPLYIDDTAGSNLMDIHAKLRRLQAENGLGLVVVDYLQLMSHRGRSENRNQEVSAISRGLKLLAKELRIPFIVLSQLSRAPETRPGDHRPQLSDLRESGCLTGDTLIPVSCDGTRVPISDLVGRTGFCVWALDESSLRLVPAPVSNAFCTGEKPVFRVRTQLGREIRATANHPFLTLEGWRRLDQIAPGDLIALPRGIRSQASASMTEDEAALLGHLLGDGCTLPNHAIQYTTREADLAELVVELANRIFGVDVQPRIQRERSWYQVYLASTRKHTHGIGSAVADWMRDLGVWGLRSWEKRVPDQVFRQPANVVATFLRHLWATDGCLHIRGERPIPRVYYATSSKGMAADVQSALLRLGINARRQCVPQRGKGRDQHHVVLSGKPDLLRFADAVGTAGNKRQRVLSAIRAHVSAKTENTNRDVIPRTAWESIVKPRMIETGMTSRQLAADLDMAYCGTTLYRSGLSRERARRVARAIDSERLRALADSEVYWDKLAAVEPDGTERVFDLTVPGHHNFVANDILVHNSIEQDADLVAFIYREEVYNRDREDLKGKAKLIIAKQRNGPIGDVNLVFLKEYTKFENPLEDLDETPGGEY
jgi:replicative DNA helicase